MFHLLWTVWGTNCFQHSSPWLLHFRSKTAFFTPCSSSLTTVKASSLPMSTISHSYLPNITISPLRNSDMAEFTTWQRAPVYVHGTVRRGFCPSSPKPFPSNPFVNSLTKRILHAFSVYKHEILLGLTSNHQDTQSFVFRPFLFHIKSPSMNGIIYSRAFNGHLFIDDS